MNHRIKLSILGLAAAAQGAIALTAMAAGPNLLSNHTFDSNVNGWETKPNFPAASVAWDAGRLRVTNEYVGNTSHGSATQCVTGIQEGQTYRYEVDAFDPSQSRRGYAEQRIFWLAGNDCTNYTNPILSPMGPITIQKNQWTHLSYDSVAPQGTHSALVFLVSAMYKAENGEPADATRYVFFDNASFTNQSVSPIDQPGDEPGNPGDEPGDEGCEPCEETGNPGGGSDVPQGPFDVPIPGPLGNPPPTNTPTPAPTPSPVPQQPQVPSQPQQPTPAPQPEQPADEPAVDVTFDEPLPPSTGSGLALTTGSRSTDIIVGALIFAAGMFATAGSLVWRREAVRNR